MSTTYFFIIDTDQYAGNFERELCAFCTGVIGECDVGKEEQTKFINDYGEEKANDEMWELLEQRPDDNGCFRPVSIDPRNNNSVCIYFHDKPSQEIIDMIKERAEKFTQGISRITRKQRTMKICGFRMKKETTTEENVSIDIE